MLISPSDHYFLHEVVASDSKALRVFIDGVEKIASDTECDVIWRGQRNHSWGVSSSLARMTDNVTGLTDPDLAVAERELILEAREWVTATTPTSMPMNNLEWLALLQHHGVPTRLIDFTSDPLVATFFAVEQDDDIEGRLFAIAVPKSNHYVMPTEAASFSIDAMSQGVVRIWRPRVEISPRLAAQSGVFALGRLPSTSPARHVRDGNTERLMTRAEIASVMSIPLYFVNLSRGAHRRTQNFPSCFTAKIHVDKATVRAQLAKRTSSGSLRPSGMAIDHASCYPDVDGMSQHSPVVERYRGT